MFTLQASRGSLGHINASFIFLKFAVMYFLVKSFAGKYQQQLSVWKDFFFDWEFSFG